MSGKFEVEALIGHDRVHQSIYTDPAIFAREMEAIFERAWVFIGHESEVLLPGEFKTTRIGRQPAIMSRHTDGRIHVLMNRCMHRGAQVCREERGVANGFHCIYHGWSYNGAGELTGVPFIKGYGANFEMEKYNLRHAPRVDSYKGFVFASLSEDGADLRQYLGKTTEIIDLILDASPEGEIEVRSGVQKYSYPGNWKFQIENWVDGYHPNFTHQTAFGARQRRTGQKGGSTEGTGARALSYPNGHALLDYTGTKPTELPGLAKAHPEYAVALEQKLGKARTEQIMRADVQLLLFPGFFIQSHRQHFRVVRPIAVDQTEVYAFPYTLKGVADEFNRSMTEKLGWWASAGGFGQPDDVEAFTRCQEGLQVTSAEWVIFLRGLERETHTADGEVVSDVTDEVTQRGIYREWKKQMMPG
ncbi:MAG: Dioxygenase large subunit [Noviherbaspirillum sp.]|nr:Dioxygenase large subunit [Noviherbaspirillum sp.]